MSSTMWRRHASSKDEAELPHVVVDTNVFISLLTDRDDAQRALAKELLLHAETGEIMIVLPQFILFELLMSCESLRPSRLRQPLRRSVTRSHCPALSSSRSTRGRRFSISGPTAFRPSPTQESSLSESLIVTMPSRRSIRSSRVK